MNNDGSADMAANAWPGFVDILSAVVIMFVFFVLITAAVLYFYTITYKAKVEGQVAAAVTEAVEGSQTEKIEELERENIEKVEELERENQELREKIESVQAKISEGGGASESETVNETEAAQSFGAQANDQLMSQSDDNSSLVLFHDPGAITVDQESEAKIGKFVDDAIQKYGADNIEILLTSPKSAEAVTQARAKRLAVARMLNVRNGLLKSSASRENIQLNVVASEQIEESADWTRLQIKIRP